MSLGKRGPNEKQEPIWIEASRLATPVGQPFYERLNQLLNRRGFDSFAEGACRKLPATGARVRSTRKPQIPLAAITSSGMNGLWDFLGEPAMMMSKRAGHSLR